MNESISRAPAKSLPACTATPNRPDPPRRKSAWSQLRTLLPRNGNWPNAQAELREYQGGDDLRAANENRPDVARHRRPAPQLHRISSFMAPPLCGTLLCVLPQLPAHRWQQSTHQMIWRIMKYNNLAELLVSDEAYDYAVNHVRQGGGEGPESSSQ
jgi:hypothetical protein